METLHESLHSRGGTPMGLALEKASSVTAAMEVGPDERVEAMQ